MQFYFLSKRFCVMFMFLSALCVYPSFCQSNDKIHRVNYNINEETPRKDNRLDKKVKQFIEDLQNPKSDDDTRHTAVWALGNLGDKKAVPYLIKVLESDKNENIRSIAAEALGKLRDPSAVDPLVNALKDKDWGVRVDTIIALGRIKEYSKRSIPKIIQALNDEDETVRMTACKILGIYKDKDAVSPLCGTLKDKNQRVKKSAIIALGLIGDEKAIEPLYDILRKDKDEVVRVSVIQALGDIKGSKAIKYVTGSLDDENAFVRLYAIITLGQIGDEGSLKVLEKLSATEEDKDTKDALKKAIENINKSIHK